MKLILCGPPGSGKTTLARIIGEYGHKPVQNLQVTSWDQLSEIDGEEKLTILDNAVDDDRDSWAGMNAIARFDGDLIVTTIRYPLSIRRVPGVVLFHLPLILPGDRKP